MILTEATSPSQHDSYMENDYFAFVESFEFLDPKAVSGVIKFPDDWDSILEIRGRKGLELPSAALWLDCVKADYFASLDWRDDECQINNKGHSDRRRKLLMDLDTSQFVVALLLIDVDGESERDEFGRFSEMSWHVIQLDPTDGLPVLAAPDFDLDPHLQKMRYVKHKRFLNESEFKSLSNVFSLNFLPDTKLDGRERPNPTSPPRTDKGRVRSLSTDQLYEAAAHKQRFY